MTGRLVQGLDGIPPEARGGVLTIGNFDGVHVGHQEILRTGRDRADAAGGTLVALTFDPPPMAVLAPDARLQQTYGLSELGGLRRPRTARRSSPAHARARPG